MIMGVVADDITGSNDIGIMFTKAGLLTHVYAFPGAAPPGTLASSPEAPDITILDTNSRLDAPDVAYDKVFAATRALMAAGCSRFHNKTCSVFRGNIGVEFDAMLDALGQEFAVVVLGFPKNGRQTINGVHYVRGVKLEESEFRNDPVHPMRRSNLVEILQAQTRRSVGLIDHRVVAQGADALREAVEAARARWNYVILDVVDQAALATIARAVKDCPVLCGSSAIAEELPAAWGVRPVEHAGSPPPRVEGLGVLCAAGSLMPQTAAQVEHLRAQGVPAFELDPRGLFEPDARSRTIDDLTDRLARALRAGDDALLHTARVPETVAAVRAEGARRGLSERESARLVSETLAEIVAQVIGRTGLNRLLVAGGETSNAVSQRLGIDGLRIWREIQPGLPSCLSLGDAPLLLVLKSGSFGSPEFFAQAIDHLKTQ